MSNHEIYSVSLPWCVSPCLWPLWSLVPSKGDFICTPIPKSFSNLASSSRLKLGHSKLQTHPNALVHFKIYITIESCCAMAARMPSLYGLAINAWDPIRSHPSYNPWLAKRRFGGAPLELRPGAIDSTYTSQPMFMNNDKGCFFFRQKKSGLSTMLNDSIKFNKINTKNG